jgi:Calx-beta domain
MRRPARSLMVLVVTVAAFAMALASQAGVASASVPWKLRGGVAQVAAVPAVAPTSNDVGTWEVEGKCSGDPCFATVTISIGGQEAEDPACSPHVYCVSTLSGGLYFYGEAVSISPGSSGTWTYNCNGCRGKELIDVTFKGNEFTGTGESLNEQGVGGGGTAPYLGHLISGGGAGLPTLSVAGTTVVEPTSGTSTADFPVTLSEASTSTVTVDYTTQDGTGTTAATAPRDYQATQGTLTFAPGETSQTIPVSINHSEFSGKRTFTLALSNPQEAEIATDEATETINALRKSSTTLQCAEAGPGSLTCTASVGDTTGTLPFVNPTGEISFTATAGSFQSSHCILKPGDTPDSSTCPVNFTPPTPSNGPIKITASYPGDSVYEASSGISSLCADGKLLELGSITTTAPHTNGFELHSPVVLHGCGFNAGMLVTEWGAGMVASNESQPTINADGTEATIAVPWNATTGDVVVSVTKNTAKLAAQQVDSWRNTEGLSFPNYGSSIFAQEFVAAFAGTKVAEGTLSDGEPKILGLYQQEFREHSFTDGLCYGFAYLTSTLADGTGTTTGFLGGAPTPFQLIRGSEIETAIKTDWLKQFSDQNEIYKFRRTVNTNGADIRAQLEAAFGGDGYHHPALLGIYWTTIGPKGEEIANGHAITAFGIREAEAPYAYGIETYNSNAPFNAAEDTDGRAHEAALTKSAVKVAANGEWSFPEFEAHGGATEIKVAPIAALEGPLTLQPSGTTNNLGVETNLEAATDPSTGKPVDLAAGGSGDVAVVPVPDEGQSTPAAHGPGVAGIEGLNGPVGDWAETISNTKGPVADSFLSAGGGAWLQASSGADSVSFDSAKDSIEVAPAAGQPASHTGSLTVVAKTRGTGERILTVTGPVVSAHASVSLLGGHAALGVSGSGSFDVRLAVEGAGSAWQTYDAGQIRLGAGQTLSLTPADWSHLGSGRISATVSTKHGKHSLHLHNHLKAPAAKALRSTITRAAKTAKLNVTLATPALNAEAGVEVIVTVRHAGHVLTHAHAAIPIGSARHASVTIALAKAIPAAATAQFTVITEVGGTTPSTARTKRTLTLAH